MYTHGVLHVYLDGDWKFFLHVAVFYIPLISECTSAFLLHIIISELPFG